MQILGLTGGIGSGKSTVAGIFRTLGVPVYDSDQRAKELYFLPEVRSQVEALLGKTAYKSATEINKPYIRAAIFTDKSVREKINAIIHPAVKKDFESFKKQHKKEKYIVKESALLFEAGIARSVDKILLVTASPELRKARLLKRDKLNEKEIEQMLLSQAPDKEKIKLSTWVIENNEQKLLIPQVINIHEGF